jgi:hypothetical protein
VRLSWTTAGSSVPEISRPISFGDRHLPRQDTQHDPSLKRLLVFEVAGLGLAGRVSAGHPMADVTLESPDLLGVSCPGSVSTGAKAPTCATSPKPTATTSPTGSTPGHDAH